MLLKYALKKEGNILKFDLDQYIDSNFSDLITTAKKYISSSNVQKIISILSLYLKDKYPQSFNEDHGVNLCYDISKDTLYLESIFNTQKLYFKNNTLVY